MSSNQQVIIEIVKYFIDAIMEKRDNTNEVNDNECDNICKNVNCIITLNDNTQITIQK